MTVGSEYPQEQRQCDFHGTYAALLIRGKWSRCTQCEFLDEQANERKKQAIWQEELKAKEWNRKLGRAAIPERFRLCTLDNYIPGCQNAARALLIASGYADDFDNMMKKGTCLIFCGGIGTGKTHLAAGIAHRVMEKGRQAVFISVIAAVRSVKETYSRKSEKTESQAIRDLTDPDLLILDEVGIQLGSDTEKIILFEIINGRYEAMRPTVLISNLDASGVESALGTRGFDRLREGNGRMVAFDWDSFRTTWIE
jgi:DNA replication protein DnaC